MIFELKGKSALVTGAGSGIGAAIAGTFARAGAHVFVTDVKLATASETAGRITSAGGTATPLELDVRDEAACAEIARQTGPLDILVNNAGIGHVGSALDDHGRRSGPLVRRQRPRHVERHQGLPA
jgi:NAD(P)-dependent dehydrogenase (short-subunit alcohol dehydrogenase family)